MILHTPDRTEQILLFQIFALEHALLYAKRSSNNFWGGLFCPHSLLFGKSEEIEAAMWPCLHEKGLPKDTYSCCVIDSIRSTIVDQLMPEGAFVIIHKMDTHVHTQGTVCEQNGKAC